MQTRGLTGKADVPVFPPGYVVSVCPDWPQRSDSSAVPVLQYNKRRQMIQLAVSLPEEI